MSGKFSSSNGMRYRAFVIIILFVCLSFGYTPTRVEAATTASLSSLRRELVAKQIELLLLQIRELQAKLQLVRAASPLIDQGTLNTSVRQAVVNILCENQGQSPFKSISGSGVIIDPRGVILTNAHIGQYFLVKDHPSFNAMLCVVRTGSPALPAYYARLMYLPQAWVVNNRATITTEGAAGTGEDDYALLVITGSATPTSLPSSFPHVPIDDTVALLTNGYPVLLASYPGELVGSVIIKNSLSMTSALTTINQGYYFENNQGKNLDLIDVSGTVLSQAGSSGGAAVSLRTGKLIGIIVTATDANSTSDRELRAVTLAHIGRSLFKYTGQTLEQFLVQSPHAAAATFFEALAATERSLLTR